MNFNTEDSTTQDNIHIDFAAYNLGNFVCEKEDELFVSNEPREVFVIINGVQDPVVSSSASATWPLFPAIWTS